MSKIQEQIQHLQESLSKNGNDYRLYRRGQRTLMNAVLDSKGRELEYEVFHIRIQAAGEVYGNWYPTREVYPSSESFGSSAVWCKDLVRSFAWFNAFEEGPKQSNYIELRPAVEEMVTQALKSTISIPKSEVL